MCTNLANELGYHIVGVIEVIVIFHDVQISQIPPVIFQPIYIYPTIDGSKD